MRFRFRLDTSQRQSAHIVPDYAKSWFYRALFYLGHLERFLRLPPGAGAGQLPNRESFYDDVNSQSPVRETGNDT